MARTHTFHLKSHQWAPNRSPSDKMKKRKHCPCSRQSPGPSRPSTPDRCNTPTATLHVPPSQWVLLPLPPPSSMHPLPRRPSPQSPVKPRLLSSKGNPSFILAQESYDNTGRLPRGEQAALLSAFAVENPVMLFLSIHHCGKGHPQQQQGPSGHR